MGIFSAIFGGGTSGASEQSQEAQIAANQATERFIREQTGQARQDVLGIFPQAAAAGQRGFEGALNLISQGLPSQVGAFQQGNVGAQNVLAQTLPQIQNAILGLPTQAVSPFSITPDLGFLQNIGGGQTSSFNDILAPILSTTKPTNIPSIPLPANTTFSGQTPQIVLKEGDPQPTLSQLISTGLGSTFPTDLVGTPFSLAQVVNPDGRIRDPGSIQLTDGQLEELAAGRTLGLGAF